MYPNMCIKQQTCEYLDSVGHRICKKIMKEKTPIIKGFSWKILLFKNTLFKITNSY